MMMYFLSLFLSQIIFSFTASTSVSRGKAIDRIPLPPPFYGPSVRKTSNSSSSRPTPPSFSGGAPGRTAPPLSSVSDAHVNASFPFLDLYHLSD